MTDKTIKYSDLICECLKNMGYTHCFMVAGGNIMHLIGSAKDFFKIVPVVNEVAAGIAAEYFNESNKDQKAFVLVTAGPGLTNILTAISGAYLESRDLLVIGGQVKISDLSDGSIRQNGIQEINGVSLVSSITKISKLIKNTVNAKEFVEMVSCGLKPRKGPVFIEMPLDIQAKMVCRDGFFKNISFDQNYEEYAADFLPEAQKKVQGLINSAKRPVILIGAGVTRAKANTLVKRFSSANIPIMLTWNAADRICSTHPLYFGRPNTWGQRYSNILIQQSDLLIAVGTRLGMQQSGFNWQEFIPNGKIIHIDCDEAELNKNHPTTDLKINCDANKFLDKFLNVNFNDYSSWVSHCREVKNLLPINEKNNNITGRNYISPYDFVENLSKISSKDDVIIPCSSGGAFTVMMQVFLQKSGQIIITNKALASMGYGLSGAIGASIANPESRTILVEGDGGFAQNLQEIATANANKLNLKIFILENSGYASIRMTQRNYFGGEYVGCDTNTGLGFPNWNKLFDAYGVESMNINNDNFSTDSTFLDLFSSNKCVAFIVKIDPEQTYFPKISSRVTADGGMESNPLHLMSPELSNEIIKKVIKY